MAYRLTAQTNKGSYRPAYYHLNEHHDLGWSAKVVAGKFHIDGDGARGVRWLYITTSRPVTESELIRGILWQLHQQCACEHDCCCVQTVAGGNNVQLNHRWTIKASRRHNSTATRWAVPAVSYCNI